MERRYNLFVQLSESQLEAALTGSDAIDAKALGLLGGELALAALISVLAPRAWHWSWVPVIALFLLSVVLLIVAASPRKLDAGPDLWDLSRKLRGVALELAIFQVFMDLQSTQRANRPLLKRKETQLTWGFRSAVAWALAGIFVLLLAIEWVGLP